MAYTNGGTLGTADFLPGLLLPCGRGFGTGAFLTFGAVSSSRIAVGGALERLLRGARVVVVSGSLMGLLAIELTFSRLGCGKSNKSTAARFFLRDWRLFDCEILVVLGFLGLIADLGSDKKSCAFNSSGECAGELALIFVTRLGCGDKVAGSDAGISGPFGGWGGRRRPDLPDSVALPDLGGCGPELVEAIEDITDNIDRLGNRSATSYSFCAVNFKFKIF
ncbi:hypothetical protein [Microcoleus sp.]|uniref:hypothetical protein n=1 Tax=Microcoleus sp. TaxID=44472 RepID=UPI0035941117